MSNDLIQVHSWDLFVGQEPLKERLQIHIDASKERESRQLHPIMLFGPPGIGKTTLAGLIAQRFGADFVSLKPPYDARMLRFLLEDSESEQAPLVLFLDEIHGATKPEQEMMYSVLEGGYFQYKNWRVETPHVSVIAATTEGDKLNGPLLERFEIKPAFKDYEPEEMVRIAVQMMALAGLGFNEEFARGIAGAATGSPRRLKAPIFMARDLADLEREYDVKTVLDMCNITEDGLTDHHVNYLMFMESQGGTPCGLEVLTLQLDLSAGMVKDLERLFLSRRWIERTTKGRELTPNGRKRVKQLKESK
jgi:Holliday junction DNA helicase RuvB